MKRKILHIITLILIFNNQTTSSSYKKSNLCKPSTLYLDNNEPKNFPQTNNLTTSTGKKTILTKEKIILKGQLLTTDCIPIPNAKVYLWQKGNDNEYHYKLLRNNLEKNNKTYTTFTGIGTTITNNNGEFQFITITPFSNKKNPAYFNIKVVHYQLGTLQTKVYIKDIRNNLSFNIIMSGSILNKSY